MSTTFMSNKSKYQNFYVTIILLIAILGGYAASNYFFNGENKGKNKGDNKQNNFLSLKLYPQPKAFTGFSLTDKENNKINENYFAGKWTLLFFGYTNCPDVCPTTLNELKKTFHALKQANKIKQMPEVLFVSVDSERDTVAHLKEYIAFFNPKFNAATANDANILALTRQIGAAYHIEKHEAGNKNYAVDHTVAIFLISPKKKLYAIFRSPHIAKNMAADLTQLIGEK